MKNILRFIKDTFLAICFVYLIDILSYTAHRNEWHTLIYQKNFWTGILIFYGYLLLVFVRNFKNVRQPKQNEAKTN